MLNLVREVRVNQEDCSYKHDDNAEILLHNDLCTMFITLFSTCKVRNNLANTKILMYYAMRMRSEQNRSVQSLETIALLQFSLTFSFMSSCSPR